WSALVVFLPPLLEIGALWHPRRVNVVGPEIDVTGFALVAAQEIQRLVNKVCAAVPAFDLVVLGPDPICSSDDGIGLRAFPSAGVFIEAVFAEGRRVGDVAAAAHVPFAEMAGHVARFLERACDGRSFGVEKIRLFAFAIAGAGLQVAGHAPARREHASRKGCPRGRTDGRGNVELRELVPSAANRSILGVGTKSPP